MLTEDEARALLARSARNRADRGKPILPRRSASTACCQSARPSGVTLAETDAQQMEMKEQRAELERRCAEAAEQRAELERQCAEVSELHRLAEMDPKQADIERRYAEAEKRGEVMVLKIPLDDQELEEAALSRTGNACGRTDKAADHEDNPYRRLEKRIAKFAAKEVMEKRGFHGAEIVLPEDRKRRNKYGNQKVEIDGLKFDSKHEAAVYQELMARVRAGELKCVLRQVRFDLGGGQNASRDSRYAYYADFVTVDRDNRVEVLDAKSEATRKNRTYINKKKQVIAEWGLDIREV